VYSFWGIPIVWVAATLGQTLAFLLARYLLRDLVLLLTLCYPASVQSFLG
jgi:uncharacterized membrane protein YdjX (TVP38/TMEM64 family)